MVFRKLTIQPSCNITVNWEKINQVEQLLGKPSNSWRKMRQGNKTPNWNSEKCFRSMEKVLTTRSITMPTKLCLLKCYVWSTLLYGCEGWTISNTMKTRLEATELWFLRRMMRISWTDKLTNEAVYYLKQIHREASWRWSHQDKLDFRSCLCWERMNLKR